MASFLLATGEHIRKTLRPSKVALLPSVALVLLCVFVPVVYGWGLTLPKFLTPLWRVWFVFWLVWLAWKISRWSLERYVITNERLIVIRHESPIKRFVEETPLGRILNVGLERSGVLESVFGLGTVLVRAVGLEKSLELKHLKNAPQVVRELWQTGKNKNESNQQMTLDRHRQYPQI